MNSEIPFYSSDILTLSIKRGKNQAVLDLFMYGDLVNTSALPQAYRLLEVYLPGVFKTTCFNSKNLPFSEEVKKTETGHLFEHIFLEYIALEYEKMGEFRVYNGTTYWDWDSEPKGHFRIVLDVGRDAGFVFDRALQATIIFFEEIICSTQDSRNYSAILHKRLDDGSGYASIPISSSVVVSS